MFLYFFFFFFFFNDTATTEIYTLSLHDALPIPKVSALLLAVAVDERVASVTIEIIHDQVNGLSEGILFDDMPHHASERGARTIRCRRGEVPPGLWLNDTKYVRRAAPFVLIVLLGWAARLGRDRRAHIGVQRYRLFVQANDRLGAIVGLFIDGQHVLHLPDVLLVQFRDAPHFFPATASGRGFVAKPGLSPALLWGPVCA